MRYGTWTVNFDDNETYGTTPTGVEGAFEHAPKCIAGYLNEDVDILSLSKWNVVELTKEQFLEMAFEQNATVELKDGKIWTPKLLNLEIPTEE